MRLVLLLLLLSLSACAPSAPIVRPAPPPAAEVTTVTEPELRALPPPEPAPPPPVPAAAPKGSIEGRSVYPQPGLVEWRLSNGMTVVYKRLAAGGPAPVAMVEGRAPGGFMATPDPVRRAHAVARVRWGTVRGRLAAHERQLFGTAVGLRELLEDVAAVFSEPPSVADTAAAWRSPTDGPWGEPEARLPDAEVVTAARAVFDEPGAFTLVLVGEAPDAEAEALVGTLLGPLRARPDRTPDANATGLTLLDAPTPRVADGGGAPVVQQLRIRARADDAAALAVLAAALVERADDAAVRYWLDPQGGVAELTAEADSPIDLEAWLRPLSDADVARARRQSLATEADLARPRVWLDVVGRHYRAPGAYRPARPPREIADWRRRVGAVSTRQANALLAQFRSTPSRATLTSD